MKIIRKIAAMVMLLSLCAGTVNSAIVSADAYQDHFAYKKGDKLYTMEQIIKGKKRLTKNVKEKYVGYPYQIVKFSDGKVTLRPPKGLYDSAYPYFAKKTFTYKISPKCKFYYTDTCFPLTEEDDFIFKKVTRKNVIEYMNEEYTYYDDEGVKVKYCLPYFGEMYVKNGEIAAVLTKGSE